MITDRKLLELAAKAAGLVIDTSPCNGGGQGNIGFDASGNAVLDWHNGTTWNPLTDDGDALRLAVNLGMNLVISDELGITDARVPSKTGWCTEQHWDNTGAATRRAIVRAAAEVGGAMP